MKNSIFLLIAMLFFAMSIIGCDDLDDKDFAKLRIDFIDRSGIQVKAYGHVLGTTQPFLIQSILIKDTVQLGDTIMVEFYDWSLRSKVPTVWMKH